jgi:cytochrome c peroxidase
MVPSKYVPPNFNFRKQQLTNQQYEDKTTKTLMMLPTDMALVSDKAFKQWIEKYAKDEDLFFKDFAAVIVKLFELGVPFAETTSQAPMTFKTSTA